jgi:predicted PurR-regulated permease PerM
MNNNNNDKNNQRIDLHIPISTIILLLGVALSLWFLFSVKEILLLLFISVFIAALVNNGVKYLQKYIKTRIVAVFIIYIIFVILFIGTFVLLIPILLDQIAELHDTWPDLSAKLIAFAPTSWRSFLTESLNLEAIDWQATVGLFLTKTMDILGSVFNLMVVFALSFYMSLEESAWDKAVDFFLPKKYYEKVMFAFNKIEKQLSQWFQAQLTLSVIMALLAYIGLTIIGVKYALVVALLAFIGEFVPYLGPIASTFFAVLFAFLQGPLVALVAFIWFVIINQVENHILVPNIMRRAVGLNPIITIIALLVGFKLAGIAGTLLAIPVATILGVLIKVYFKKS